MVVRLSFATLFTSGGLAACGEKPAAVVFDAGPIVPPPASQDLPPVEPPVEDAGLVEDADAAKPKGSGQTTNQTRVLACCRSIDLASKGLAPGSAELGVLKQQAATCKTLAAQIGPNATGAELAPFRSFLKSVKLPNACPGL